MASVDMKGLPDDVVGRQEIRRDVLPGEAGIRLASGTWGGAGGWGWGGTRGDYL